MADLPTTARGTAGRSLLQRGWAFFFPPRIATAAELQHFIGGEASYVTHKAVMGYCRVKTMLHFEKLMKDPNFVEGIEICRWETFALTLSDLTVLNEGFLRPADAAQRAQVANWLTQLYPRILNQHVPPHRADRGWADHIEAFDRRFALASMSSPKPPRELCAATAATMLDLAPIMTRQKRNDLEVVAGDMSFHLVAIHDAMRRRFDLPALQAALGAAAVA